jgi:hypothetical protein
MNITARCCSATAGASWPSFTICCADLEDLIHHSQHDGTRGVAPLERHNHLLADYHQPSSVAAIDHRCRGAVYANRRDTCPDAAIGEIADVGQDPAVHSQVWHWVMLPYALVLAERLDRDEYSRQDQRRLWVNSTHRGMSAVSLLTVEELT